MENILELQFSSLDKDSRFDLTLNFLKYEYVLNQGLPV